MSKSEKKEIWNDSFAYRIRKKIVFENLINNFPKTHYFLDIGVGCGNFCRDMAKKGFSGEGIDIYEEATLIAEFKTRDYAKQLVFHKQNVLEKEANSSNSG